MGRLRKVDLMRAQNIFKLAEPSSVSTLTLTRRALVEIAKEIRLVPNRRKLNIKQRLSGRKPIWAFLSIFTRLSEHFLFSSSSVSILTFKFDRVNHQTPRSSRVTVMFLCFFGHIVLSAQLAHASRQNS